MTTTVLFGGSFDPPHKGHVNAVHSLLGDKSLSAERIVIMPTFISPFKPIGGSASAEDRLAMCRLAFSEIPQCIISDMEISAGKVSYTVETLRKLKKIYPHDRLVLAIGSDLPMTLLRWYCYREIISAADIAVFARKDSDYPKIAEAAEIIRADGGSVITVKTSPLEISSTDIREKILNNEDISCYLPDKVVKYIVDKRLYSDRG